MRNALPFLLLFSLLGAMRQEGPQTTPARSYSQIRDEAESFYSRKSYQRAHDVYLQARDLDLDADDANWVRFRLADTGWRAAASTERSDESHLQQARDQLVQITQGMKDPVWVEAQVSLGDFFWMRRNRANWHAAWAHYQPALDYWAGSEQIEPARQDYLGLILRISEPTWSDRASYSYGHWGNYLPVDVLANALRLVRSSSDRAHLSYLMASTLAAHGNRVQQRRAGKYFSAALEEGPGRLWYDDALFRYAQFLSSVGKIRFSAGQWRNQPDYAGALGHYRRLVSEFDKGETRYFDDAQRLIKEIVSPRIQVAVSNVFLPDSNVQFQLSARNVDAVQFKLYRVDLTSDVHLDEPDGKTRHEYSKWIQAIRHGGRRPVLSWSEPVVAEYEYAPVQRTESVDSRLSPGAYLLTAGSEGVESQELILVSQSALVMKTYKGQATAYFCNAIDGSPISGAAVSFWRYSHHRKLWQLVSSRTNDNGIASARFDARDNTTYNYVATAASQDEQAFSLGWGYLQETRKWTLYLVTDRPAYRPGDTVRWKLVARQQDESGYTTPAYQTLEYEIRDPQGGRVAKESVDLNRFGSTWGTLEVKEAFPLGEYQIRVWDKGRNKFIGSETVFRIEEYKLPEFRVRVETPQENGRAKVYRIGEQVQIKARAEYYFGGPLVGAEAEVIVYQRPLQHYWLPQGPFAWLKDSSRSMNRHYGGWRGQEVSRTTTKTDQSGTALVSVQTDSAGLQDVEFEVEVRVRDASRREVVATGSVRVTRQRYFAHVRPRHHLHRPGDQVEIDFQSVDANQQPFPTQAEVRILRSHWKEVWIDPEGRHASLTDYEKRGRSLVSGRMVSLPGWRLRSRGYEDEEVVARTIRTDADGKARMSFVADREGYFRIQWNGDLEEDFPVQAMNQVWVTKGGATRLGYRHGGVQVILDQDSTTPGRSATVMLSTQSSGRYVWFSVEADGLDSHQIVHVPGTAKLIRLDLESRHIPNVFLKAVMVSDHQIFEDTRELIVPPQPNQISVELESDQEKYQPGDTGKLTVRTRDAAGEAVSAEVAIGVVDDSVYAIQGDYATDPLRHFFGQKRSLQVQTLSTFQQRAYLTVKDEKGFANGSGLSRDDQSRGLDSFRDGNEVGGVRRSARERGFLSESRLEESTENFEMNKLVAAKAPMESAQRTQPGQPAIQVRSDFRTTAAWVPAVVTDTSGEGLVPVRFSDSLTTWRATARAVSDRDLFGQGTTTVLTNQPLMVRLQSPRFLQAGDTTTVSAIVNNNSDDKARVRVNLGVKGVRLNSPALRILTVPSQGESRVDWTLDVRVPGSVRLEVSARSSHASDAMRRELTAHAHGIEKLVATAGKTNRERTALTVTLPPHQETDRQMIVQITPSLAVTMLDALPYLIDYPYGCTEQTMSRFLPAAITARTLAGLGLSPEAIAGRIFGGIEVEHAARTHTTEPFWTRWTT